MMRLQVKRATGLRRITGLMFRTRKTKPLFFEFGKDVKTAIHSLFVFFPFLAVWLDKNGKIIAKRVVKPFSLSIKPEKEFRKLIEIPLKRASRA